MKKNEEETGVAILSLYPLTDIQRIVLPVEGPGKRRRVALGATIKVRNNSIRFYSVHSETRIPVDRKIEQMNAVLLANQPQTRLDMVEKPQSRQPRRRPANFPLRPLAVVDAGRPDG